MWWRRRRSLDDFREEIESHLALEADEIRREGPCADIDAASRRAFGNVAAIQGAGRASGRGHAAGAAAGAYPGRGRRGLGPGGRAWGVAAVFEAAVRSDADGPADVRGLRGLADGGGGRGMLGAFAAGGSDRSHSGAAARRAKVRYYVSHAIFTRAASDGPAALRPAAPGGR